MRTVVQSGSSKQWWLWADSRGRDESQDDGREVRLSEEVWLRFNVDLQNSLRWEGWT